MASYSSDRMNAAPSADQCASELMETIYPIVQFIRTEMRHQRDSSLSVPQFRLLAFLSRHPGSSLSNVAEHLGVTRATASTMTDRLVQQGFVNRSDDPHERRYVVLNLTPPGSHLLEQMREFTRNRITDLLDRLTPEELVNVSTGLKILGQLFQTPSTRILDEH